MFGRDVTGELLARIHNLLRGMRIAVELNGISKGIRMQGFVTVPCHRYPALFQKSLSKGKVCMKFELTRVATVRDRHFRNFLLHPHVNGHCYINK